MKKILTVLLIAVMATSFVFAGVSGKARIDFGYDTASEKFGFQVDESKIDFDFKVGEKAASDNKGDVYGVASGEISIRVANSRRTDNKQNVFFGNGSLALKVSTSVSAKIVGKNWSIAYKTVKDNPADFAKSPVDTFRDVKKDVFDEAYDRVSKPVSLQNGYSKQADRQGIEINVANFLVGVAADGFKAKTKANESNYAFYFVTPELGNNFKVKFGALDYFKAAVDPADVNNTFGASLKLAYAKDEVSQVIAVDTMYNKNNIKPFNFDISESLKVGGFTLDAYYVSYVCLQQYQDDGVKVDGDVWERENYLSGKVAYDFTKVGAPIKITFKMEDIAYKNNKQTYFGEVAYNGPVAASLSYKFARVSKESTMKASIGYDFGMVKGTAKAEFKFTAEKATKFFPQIWFESDKLVKGATLSLGWYTNENAKGDAVSDLLNGSKDKGVIRARCEIKF